MNYTESFQEFSSKLGPVDLALYAGVALVLWVLFKDKVSPIQKLLGDFINKTKNSNIVPIVVPETKPVIIEDKKDDIFFKLVVSWKQTRDLAIQSGCSKAVEVADQMFPFLSPNVCNKDNTK